MWIISKSHRENFFFYIFAIHSSSRREKHCQMSLRLFSLFWGSIYQQCVHTYIVCFALNGSICTFAQQLTFHVWKHQEGLTFRGAPKMGDFLLYTYVPYFGLFFLKNMTHSLDSDRSQISKNNNFYTCNILV